MLCLLITLILELKTLANWNHNLQLFFKNDWLDQIINLVGSQCLPQYIIIMSTHYNDRLL